MIETLAGDRGAKPRILLLLPLGRSRRFAFDLAAALARDLDAEVRIAASSAAARGSRVLAVAEAAERRLFTGDGPSAWTSHNSPPASPTASNPAIRPDLLIDLSDTAGAFETIAPAAALHLRIGGRAGEGGLVDELAAGAPPTIDIDCTTLDGRVVLHRAVVALLDRQVVVRMLDTVYGRATALLLEAAAACLGRRQLPQLPPPVDRMPRRAVPVGWLLAGYARKIAARLARPFVHKADWSIGYRRRGAALPTTLAPGDYVPLPGADEHIQADPFLFDHEEQTFLFFEDMPHADNRGVIAVTSIDAAGRTAPAQTVLTRPYHLSYPFVFRDGGRIYMLPETLANRTVELYEAVVFPGEWRLAGVLLSDIDAADATLHRGADGTWWLFASVARFGGSTMDTLCLFHSDAVAGPWVPHPMNPVKNDARSARPAGRLLVDGGTLLRPAQDCSVSYGGAVTWCAVEELSRERYRERVVGRLACDPASGFGGPHTFDRSDSHEAVDFTQRRRRRLLRPRQHAGPAD